MKLKPNLPEDMVRSMRAGGHWMMLAFATDVPGAYLLSHHRDWPLLLRIAIALVPLAASLLYVRSIARWIRGMDELHQRITQAAFLFATVAYLVLSVAWDLLRRTGLFEIIFESTQLHFDRVPFGNCTFAIGMTYVLFGIGYAHIFNRRYQ